MIYIYILCVCFLVSQRDANCCSFCRTLFGVLLSTNKSYTVGTKRSWTWKYKYDNFSFIIMFCLYVYFFLLCVLWPQKKTRQTFCCDFRFFMNEISVLYLELDLEMERKISFLATKKVVYLADKKVLICVGSNEKYWEFSQQQKSRSLRKVKVTSHSQNISLIIFYFIILW